MIRKCANPDCDVEFRSSREGRLFPFEIRNPTGPCRDVPAVICEKKPGLPLSTSGCVNGAAANSLFNSQ